ncbi:MAG TPA: hypothetical protein VMZ92_04185 [Planctomycetota bacterium]|nr:hypothetical protein [Planctomycetota bacterium]
MTRSVVKGGHAEHGSVIDAARPVPRILAVVLTLVLTGCPRPPKRDLVVPTRQKEEVLSILNTHADLTRTVRATLSVTAKTPGMKKAEKCEGSLAAAYPDRLRIRGRHDLLDYPPFDIGSDGETWFVHTRFKEHDEIHLGPTRLLDERFDPTVLLSPSDIVLALGVGRLTDDPPRRQLILSRHPGFYLIDEWVSNRSGYYRAKRVTVDPELMVITRIETHRPDGATDMIAEMRFDPKATAARSVPTFARIRLFRQDVFLLELTLKDRRTGVSLPPRVFTVPNTEDIPAVYRHDSR